MAETPYCLAMVLCDRVHKDPATGKFTILGTFSTFQVREFPTLIQFSVYFAITDGIGQTNMKLRLINSEALVDESDDVFVFEPEPVDIESPLVVVESVIAVQTKVDRPGQYHCELYANDELLMSRRLLVLEAKQPSDEE